jgi:hypothetical protein
MAIWGIEGGDGKVMKELLSPLGLYSYGGGSKDSEMSYVIYSNSDKNFKVELAWSKINDIEKIYKKYLRKQKLLNINGSNIS